MTTTLLLKLNQMRSPDLIFRLKIRIFEKIFFKKFQIWTLSTTFTLIFFIQSILGLLDQKFEFLGGSPDPDFSFDLLYNESPDSPGTHCTSLNVKHKIGIQSDLLRK